MNEAGSKLLIEENVPLAPHTTLGVGGPARFLAKAKTEEHILEGLHFAQQRGCPFFVLGGGSNLLVSDSGFPGLALKIELRGIEGLDERGGRISAAAGEEWDALVRLCVDRDLAGIECLSGIPGTVGATPVQNVGAYGQETSEVIRTVRVLDRERHSITDLVNAECRFAYRSTIFNTTAKERYIILRIEFVLRPDGAPHVRYQDLQRAFSDSAPTPSLREVREAVLKIRRAKGMTLDEQDPDSRSAGSFFKNPIINQNQAAVLDEKARACSILAASEQVPRFSTPSGEEKIPAAWLIERAGFSKGYTLGNAAISSKHSLALVNRGGATAQELLDLMHRIQDRVRRLFDLDLQPEPIFIGFKPGVRF